MLLKTGACFTAELELNCPTIVDCVVALPASGFATPGTLLLGKDGLFHEVPVPVETPLPCAEVAACVAALPLGPDAIPGTTVLLGNDGTFHLLPAESQALSIAGNVISLTNGGSVTLPTTAAPVPQVLSVAGNTISLSGGGGSVVSPDAQTLSLAGNVLTISNGNNVTLPAVSVPFATPAQTIAGTSTTLAVNPADLYARENIPAQTGVSNDVTTIPAPTAGQSNWATNLLGETLHYEPGVGWQIVSKLHGFTLGAYAMVSANTINSALNIVAPRAGRMTVSAYISALLNGAAGAPKTISVFVNKGPIRFGDTAETSTNNALDANASGSFNVLVGDVINIAYVNGSAIGNASTLYSYQYES
jgi:hypothetical protein